MGSDENDFTGPIPSAVLNLEIQALGPVSLVALPTHCMTRERKGAFDIPSRRGEGMRSTRVTLADIERQHADVMSQTIRH
jgi:hypothetical protein